MAASSHPCLCLQTKSCDAASLMFLSSCADKRVLKAMTRGGAPAQRTEIAKCIVPVADECLLTRCSRA
eukprot:6183780-Pleurochrysis_carterae.AAC.2